MVHLDKLSPQLQEWIRVLMLPPEQITGEDAEKRRRLDAYVCENQRRVLRLYYGYNLSQKEAALLLKANVKTFSVTVENAKKRLRRLEAGKDKERRRTAVNHPPEGVKKTCRNCAYSCKLYDQLVVCDYAGIAKHTRAAMGIKRENGACSLWEYKTAATQARNRDIYAEAWEKQCADV